MANYQTEFLQALGMASNSLSGLMRDIREPDFQDKLRMQEQSQMRLLEKQAGIQEDRDVLQQQFTLEQMDEGQKDFLERGNNNFANQKDLDKYRAELSLDMRKKFDDYQLNFREKDADAQRKYLENNFEDMIDVQINMNRYSLRENVKMQKGRNIANWAYDASDGRIMFPNVGTQKLQQDLQGKQYNFETGLIAGRTDTLATGEFQRNLDFKEVMESVYAASGVTQEFAEENSETLNGLNAYYGNIDFNNPTEVIAAQRLLSQQNQGLFAQVRFDDMQSMAMNNVLSQGDTPDFSIEDIVAKVDDTKRDRFFGRSPEQRMEMSTARKNAYSSSLGLATLQAQYALQDKFAGINTSRQKEAIKDLMEAKTLAERLSTEQKFGSTTKADIDKNKAYYQESIKMLNTWINTLQK